MMLAWVLLIASTPPPDLSTAELRQRAEAHVRAEQFAAAGETYLKLSRRPEVHPRDELYNAHTHFENAFLVGSGAEHLCRALRLAEKVLADGVFDDEQQHLFWREVAADDLAALARDAREHHRANCRHDATGRRLAPVQLLTDADLSPPAAHPAPIPPQPAPIPPPVNDRRRRAHTAAGAMLTSLGAGLLGTMAAALAGQHRHADAMSTMIDRAHAAGRDFTLAEQTCFDNLYDDARQLRSAAIGLGVSGIAALTTGVALLSTRIARPRRTLALLPQGSLHGAGASFTLRF